jgi:AcrR family transcriptional regulator
VSKEIGRPPAAGQRSARRQEYAEETRKAIVDAARRLFAEKGYFATKVKDIAVAARVAPATVYAVSGGKYGLLQNLIDLWSTAPEIESTLNQVEQLEDPVAIIRVIASRARSMREEYGDIMRTILATAPNDPAVAASVAAATVVYRDALERVSRRLADLKSLRDGSDVKHATDVLWFYFGYVGLFTMHDENGWSYDQAEKWLADQAINGVLATSA